MSRFLDAFLAEDEKARFSGSPVPNKAEKAKTPSADPPASPAPTVEAALPGFSPFSGYSGPVIQKNAPSKTAVAEPTAGDIEALARELAADRPWQRITGEERAMAYFRAEARRRIKMTMAKQ